MFNKTLTASCAGASIETGADKTPIAVLWRERKLFRDKADALYRASQRASEALPATAGSEIEQAPAGRRAMEEEEGALNRRADAIGEKIAAMQATCIADALVQMELFAEGFFEEPGFDDYGERALFEKIMTGLRALAEAAKRQPPPASLSGPRAVNAPGPSPLP